MKLLLLNGHGININVDSAKLHIKDGFWSTDEQPQEYVFAPKRIPYHDIVIYGHSGNISLEAIKWLMKHGVGITVLNWNGELLTYIQPKSSVHVKTKFAQYQMYINEKKRLSLAKMFLKGKFARTHEVLDWLATRYNNINIDFSKEFLNFKQTASMRDLLMIEGRIARHYWTQIRKVVPKNYEFESRQYINRPVGSVDAINTMLNYGYALLESQCLRAIYGVGLDPHVGYLHDIAEGKQPLVYDLQEPYRFLIDLAVIEAIENQVFTKKDFIRTENYNLRLRPSGAQKMTASVAQQLSKKVKYHNGLYSWHYVLQWKALDLAHFIVGKGKAPDFTKPEQEMIKRIDNEEMREKILNIPYTQWKKMGFSKGTLHYMKQNARSGKPFVMREKVGERIV